MLRLTTGRKIPANPRQVDLLVAVLDAGASFYLYVKRLLD